MNGWRFVRIGLGVGLPVVVFTELLPEIAKYREVWQRIEAMPPGATAGVAIATVVNLISYWPLLLVALPGLTMRQAMISSQASTAVANAAPAGGAWGVGVTVAMYRSWGFDGDAIARAVLASGMWNILVKLAAPLAATAVIALTSESDDYAGLALASTLLLVLVVLGAVALFRSPRVARAVVGAVQRAVMATLRLARRSTRADWVAAVDRVRDQLGRFVASRWLPLTATAVASHLALLAVLVACVEAVDIEGVSMVETFGAFAVVRAALVIPLTPGGAGLAELGLSGLLIAAGGARAPAVAAVLVFRAATWLLPILIGAVTYLVWLQGGCRADAR